MKNIALKFIALSLLASMSALCGESASENVFVSGKNIHVPKGFDSNDPSVWVFLTGDLPDTCHIRPEGQISLSLDGKFIVDVSATKINDPDRTCIMATVPYMIPVYLGARLTEGSYSIVINASTSSPTERHIVIDQPTSTSIDNFTYANVTKVERIYDSNKVIIQGYHPSTCMSLKTVDVLPNANFDTFSILPIIEQTQTECARMIKPFSTEIVLDELGTKDILLHVRKIDGHAFNVYIPQE